MLLNRAILWGESSLAMISWWSPGDLVLLVLVVVVMVVVVLSPYLEIHPGIFETRHPSVVVGGRH